MHRSPTAATALCRLAPVAAAQAGVVRRDQLHRLAVPEGVVRAQLAAGRWRAVGPAVVSLSTGPLLPGSAAAGWAAVLHAGGSGRAALAGRSALAAAGLTGWPPDGVDVLVRRGATPGPLPEVGLRLHESRRLDISADARVGAPPRTGVERSAIDAAAWSARRRPACGLLAAVVQQRLTTASRLTTALDAAGPVRHARLLRTVLRDIEGGAEALTEIDFGRLCRRAGLPPPVRQEVRRDASGRRRYLDATLRDVHGRLVRVEVDGAVHLAPATYWDDMRRGNELVLAGERVLRFPSVALYLEEPVVVDQLRRAVGAGPRPVRPSRRSSDATA